VKVDAHLMVRILWDDPAGDKKLSSCSFGGQGRQAWQLEINTKAVGPAGGFSFRAINETKKVLYQMLSLSYLAV
jgi:hypothetical protein